MTKVVGWQDDGSFIRLSNVTRSALVKIYMTAVQVCNRMVRQRVQEMDAEVLQQPVVPKLVLPSSSFAKALSANPYFRKKKVGPVPADLEAPERDPAEPSKEEAKKNKVLDHLWDFVMQFGQASSVFVQYQQVPPARKTAFVAMTRAQWSMLDLKGLRAKVNALCRLREWLKESDMDIAKLEPWALKLYLFEQRSRGESVPEQHRT